MLGLGHWSGALDAFLSRDDRWGIGEAITCQIYATVSDYLGNEKRKVECICVFAVVHVMLTVLNRRRY